MALGVAPIEWEARLTGEVRDPFHATFPVSPGSAVALEFCEQDRLTRGTP